MNYISLTLLITFAASPVLAKDTHRKMDAHVHGVSNFEIAIDDGRIEMDLHSPGMDIVGFEYKPASAEDRTAVADAFRLMVVPENIVALPDAAMCHLTEVLAHRHNDDHVHDDEEGHAEHEEHEHEHGHAEGEPDDGKGAEHSSFHVRYQFDCDNPAALTTISFPFFEKFENAKEIVAKYATEGGGGSAEIDRNTAELILN